MEKFMAMPLPQRLMVVGLVVGVLGFAFHYVFIQDLTDQVAIHQQRYKRAMAEYGKLKEFDTPTFRQKLEQEKGWAMRKKAQFEKMLPEERELPDLIQSVKADADACGLMLVSFEPTRKQIEGPEYRGYEYKVKVQGEMSKLLTFLHALAGPTKRLVTGHNVKLAALGPAKGSLIAEDVGLLRVLIEREKHRQLTPTEEYAKKVLMARQRSEMTVVVATMDLVAYVYTGGRNVATKTVSSAPGPGGQK